MTPRQFQTKIEALGYSQRSFARFICQDERTIRRWIAGDRKIPTWIPVVLKLLEKLGAAGIA